VVFRIILAGHWRAVLLQTNACPRKFRKRLLSMVRFMPKGYWLVSTLLLIGLLGIVPAIEGNGLYAAPGANSQGRPNFVFVLADDMGWGDVASYGHPDLKTPNIDRMAREGIQFTQFYVASPICSPSRAAFMTGLFPARVRMHSYLATPPEGDLAFNGARGMVNYLDPEIPTVTRFLQEAGYAVGYFGKWHLGKAPGAPLPSAYGIDQYRTYDSNRESWQIRDKSFQYYSSKFIMDEGLRFIEENSGEPFFVQVNLMDPHTPLFVTEEQTEPYRKFGSALQIYYSTITRIDTEVGRLLAELDKLGLAENTIVMFSSDNGPDTMLITQNHVPGSNGPFRGRKRSLYEGGVRVPLTVRWPASAPAGRVDSTTILAAVDFLPTLSALAGIDIPKHLSIDGEEMSGAFRGKITRRKRPLYWDFRFNIRGDPNDHSPRLAVREDHWKLLMNPNRDRLELYDIPNDAGETDNLATEYPGVVDRLVRLLLDWHRTLPDGPVDPDAGSNRYPWPR